jgi:murein tripeptide amidase MpaA
MPFASPRRRRPSPAVVPPLARVALGDLVPGVARGDLAPGAARVALVALCALVSGFAAGTGPTPAMAQSPEALRTHAEGSGWTELTPHAGVVAFYEELTAHAPEVRLRSYGESPEGRALLEVTLARPAVTSPWEAHASGKPIVLINAQVHGDEPAGKEALMLLARDLATGPLNELLDDVIFVLSPQLNPDGAEAGDWGSRANLRGRNVNRDYLRLENPETRAFVTRVIATWSPHVIVDSHELVGPPRIYDFYTSFPRDFLGPGQNHALTRDEVVPAIVEALAAAGFDHFPYHRVPGGLVNDPSLGVSAGTYGARALSSYGGAHAAVTILFESMRPRDARLNLESRTHRHHVAMTAVARYVAEHAPRVVATVRAERAELADRGARWDPADSIAVRLVEVPSREEDYRIQSGGEVVEFRVPILDSAVVELGRVRPVAYLIAPEREELARHLALHGLQVDRLEQAAVVAAESFVVDSVRRDTQPYEGYVERSMWTTLRPGELEAPAGAFVVRADQPVARILFHLMEPEDVNSFAAMGWLATHERRGQTLPFHRLTALPNVPMERVTRIDAQSAPRWHAATPTPAPILPVEVGLEAQVAHLGADGLTPHDEVVGFFRALTAGAGAGASASAGGGAIDAWMTEIGRSRQGRPLHLVGLTRGGGIRTPWEAHASGRPIVFIGAQVHGDEPAGKEGLLLLARDLVQGHLNPLLDDVIFLFVPQLNPDGAEAGTWGTRNNAAGYNLNRDYLRLDNPESRAIVQEVLVPWRPHVVVDAHELGGPPRVYDFYTWFPTNPHGPRATVDLAGSLLAPAVVKALESAGHSHIIYHTPGGLTQLVENPELGIHVPVYGRTLNDYAASQGLATLLFESLRAGDARLRIADRAERQRLSMEALARAVASDARGVVDAVAEARREMAERGGRWEDVDLIAPLREPVPTRTVAYRVAEREPTETGWRYTGGTVVVETPLYDSARVTLARTRPVAYLIEAHRGDLVRQLQDHGLHVEEVLRGGEWRVESFRVDSLELADEVYEGYVPQRFRTTPEPRTLAVPAGSWLVRAGQPGDALLFHLMEPEDENSFAITGEFLTTARPGRFLPVHRVRAIPPVPVRRALVSTPGT